MVTLILNVDRDDDFGRKAGVRGPIIGKDKNLEAAIRLVLADPEDSDANALFSAISLYDKLKNENKDVEIATITGDEEVGLKSDEKINEQLKDVQNKIKIDDVILISDGEEDEYIIPIINSYAPVKHVHRVIVKQSRNLESTYYIIIKALKEKDLLRKILVPIGLVFLAYSVAVYFIMGIRTYFPVFIIIDPNTFAISFVFLTLGLYLILKGYSAGTRLKNFYSRMRVAFGEAKISISFDLISIIISIFGLFYEIEVTYNITNLFERALYVIQNMILFVMISGIIKEIGGHVENYIHNNKLNPYFWTGILMLSGVSFIIYGFMDYLMIMFNIINKKYDDFSIFIIFLGFLIAILTSISRRLLYRESAGDELQ
ncbi:MAG: DUF373 family protein [Thermoplasmata archaeon]